MSVWDDQIKNFLEESNRIEGIEHPEGNEFILTKGLLEEDEITMDLLCGYVKEITRGKGLLRDKPGMNVRVGNHVPPRGGPDMVLNLGGILESVRKKETHPYRIHHMYETLHPFMDGNGRSGRLLWAWQMVRTKNSHGIGLGFLHAFYYQTLAASR